MIFALNTSFLGNRSFEFRNSRKRDLIDMNLSNSLIIHKRNIRVWKSDEKLLIFASLISLSKIILFEKKYQAFDTVFHH